MPAVDISKFEHSPVHKAVILKDYASLRRIIDQLPLLCDPSEIHTEFVSNLEEAKADVVSSIINRRDVPNRDTPLHLAVKYGDKTAAEMLMLAGADCSLQNEHGWSALQEAIYNQEAGIAKIIVRQSQPQAWSKWCRRLPRLIGTMKRMRDFYMEITFHFESSVIPFVSRIAPSDTYRIWKRGVNLRADMTLAGFDGFKIQRSDQSVLFLGNGSEDDQIPPGSLCMVFHEDKEVMNALDGGGAPATESEVEQEVTTMFRSNLFRPGMDVTQAVLVPKTTWRGQEKTESVGHWKAKVYDMHNVVVSIKSRPVPGAMTDNDFFKNGSEDELEADSGNDNRETILVQHQSSHRVRYIPIEGADQEKKGWFTSWRRQEDKQENKKPMSDQRGSNTVSQESEYKKNLRPILWLSPEFPLQTDELIPLLDILANKVKAVRRLREILTTKLPKGTFPVKVLMDLVLKVASPL